LSELPLISIVIPTYNEGRRIGNCLDSIFVQDYPRDKLEVIVVDDYSADDTVKIASRYPVKTLFSGNHDAEISKMIGLRSSTGDLFFYLDADIELVDKSWLKKVVRPLIEDESLVGSFPRFIPKRTDFAIGRFLRYHPLELDPVLRFFCTEIEDTVVDDKGSYKICEFYERKTPPVGIGVYRREPLIKMIGGMKKFMDVDVPVILSEMGFNRFAYVPSCGIFHTNVRSLRDLIQRRLRNINKIYLPSVETRKFRYFDLRNKRDIIKIIFWVICAFSFVPLLLKGTYNTIKNKDFACMYEPIVAMALTATIIYGFLRAKKGRKMILHSLSVTKVNNRSMKKDGADKYAD